MTNDTLYILEGHVTPDALWRWLLDVPERKDQTPPSLCPLFHSPLIFMGEVSGTEGSVLSFGQKAVGLTFNPSGDPDVLAVKEAFAKAIDLCNNLRTQAGHGEKGRLLSVAITEMQGAQMWAVKGITWKD